MSKKFFVQDIDFESEKNFTYERSIAGRNKAIYAA